MLLISGASALKDDAGISQISEKCGNWIVGFDLPALEKYSKSTSHGDSEAGKVKISADTLTMTSLSEPSKVIKITITKYSIRDESLANLSSLRDMASKALSKSGVCGDITADTNRTIDGRPGVSVSGAKCSDGSTIFVAAYPVDYFFDKPGRALESSAIAVIASSYEPEATERLIGSIHIEQMV